jgi:hypothetical protein
VAGRPQVLSIESLATVLAKAGDREQSWRRARYRRPDEDHPDERVAPLLET